jgi:Tol biopolymer transport system component
MSSGDCVISRFGDVAVAGAVGAIALLSLVPSSAQVSPQLVRSQLVWVDRTGKKLSAIAPDVADFGDIELSPDRTKLAAAVLNDQTGRRELWIYDVATGKKTRVDNSTADENWLIWSPDGSRVVYNSQRGRGLDLYGRDLAGDPKETLIAIDEERGQWPVSWSPDGKNLLVVTSKPTSTAIPDNDIWVLPLGNGGKPYEFLASAAAENWAAFSPNGRWVAFSYRAAGDDTQLFVTTFPKSNRRWLVSSRGGFQARWRRDGKELFFLATNGTLTTSLMAAEVAEDGDDFEVRDVKKLFDTPVPYPPYHAFDVAADGQRVLINSLLLGPSSRRSAQR